MPIVMRKRPIPNPDGTCPRCGRVLTLLRMSRRLDTPLGCDLDEPDIADTMMPYVWSRGADVYTLGCLLSVLQPLIRESYDAWLRRRYHGILRAWPGTRICSRCRFLAKAR
jgi:hypothetical protein